MFEDNGLPVVDFDDAWNNQIEPKAIRVLENYLINGCEGKSRIFTNADYMSTYTVCYNMCIQRLDCSEPLYKKHGETIANFLMDKVMPVLKSKIHNDESFLKELSHAWKMHGIMNKWMKYFFTYLDRFYVSNNNVPSLMVRGNKLFKTWIYDSLKENILKSVLNSIQEERLGTTVVDKALIKEAVQLFVAMGLGINETYVNDFEIPLLQATKAYYAETSNKWMHSGCLTAYFNHVNDEIVAEKARSQYYLHHDTVALMLTAIDEECLGLKLPLLFGGDRNNPTVWAQQCIELFKNNARDKLKILFTILARLPHKKGLIPFAELFGKYVTDLGLEKIENHGKPKATTESNLDPHNNQDSSAKKNEKPPSADDPELIKAFICLYDDFTAMIQDVLCDPLFSNGLKDAFQTFMNRDVGKFKFADFLSSYADRLLRTGSSTTASMSESDIEVELEKIVVLFTHIVDKDLFNEIYRNQLAKRLLNQKSASNEMERVMIGKLKLRCGSQFTSKLEGMMNDLAIAVDHQPNFKKYCEDGVNGKPLLPKTDLQVNVLTYGHWPSFKAFDDIQIPKEFTECVSTFTKYYMDDVKTSSRSLKWIYSLGHVFVKLNMQKGSYELHVTTLQAIVLFCFNNSDDTNPTPTFGFERMAELTKIPEEVLKRILHSLSCGKHRIVKRIAAGGSSSSNANKGIKNDDSFVFNEAFSCPLRKFRIPMASLDDVHSTSGEVSSASVELAKKLEEERKLVLSAAIVRIMKARKQLSHSQLVAEVLSQVTFFKPDPKMIKGCIESLIERDYLERDSNNNKLYKYLA